MKHCRTTNSPCIESSKCTETTCSKEFIETDRFKDIIAKGYAEDSKGFWTRNNEKPVKKPKVPKIKPNDEIKASSMPYHMTPNEYIDYYKKFHHLSQINAQKKEYIFKITPMGKPSFQKSDRWRTLNNPNPKMRQRDVVTRWINFKQEVKGQAKKMEFIMPESGAEIIFIIPMPESWSKKKKSLMNFGPHTQKPDLDNNLKGFFDSVCEEDSYIWQYSPSKLWGYEGRIIVNVK